MTHAGMTYEQWCAQYEDKATGKPHTPASMRARRIARGGLDGAAHSVMAVEGGPAADGMAGWSEVVEGEQWDEQDTRATRICKYSRKRKPQYGEDWSDD